METGAPGQRRIREVGLPKGEAEFAGVLIHGRGRTPEEKIDLAARLGQAEPMRWLVPTAETGGSWYPNRYMDPVEANEPALTSAMEECRRAMIEASERGRIGPDHLAVLGFSQGACLSIEYALRFPGTCRAVIVFTGALVGLGTGIEEKWKAKGKLLEGAKIFLTGSDADEWIAEADTQRTAAFLRDMGGEVDVHVYHGRAHEVSPEELTEAQRFLEKHLLKKP